MDYVSLKFTWPGYEGKFCKPELQTIQDRSHHISSGQAPSACKHTTCTGMWGHTPQEIRAYEIASETIFG